MLFECLYLAIYSAKLYISEKVTIFTLFDVYNSDK